MNDSSPLDLFKLFFDQELLEIIVDETNKLQKSASENSPNFIIYTRSEKQLDHKKQLGIAGSFVMRLMQPYLRKGHSLFMDNWFTSLALFEGLHANSTGTYGTARENRSRMPLFTGKLAKSDSDYRHTDILLGVKWCDDTRSKIGEHWKDPLAN